LSSELVGREEFQLAGRNRQYRRQSSPRRSSRRVGAFSDLEQRAGDRRCGAVERRPTITIGPAGAGSTVAREGADRDLGKPAIICSRRGTFQPQNLQPAERHLTSSWTRTRALRPRGYGFREIALERSLLELGKLARCAPESDAPGRHALRLPGAGFRCRRRMDVAPHCETSS